MSNLHTTAMEAVLKAADHDLLATLKERDIADRSSEDADEAILDVAILHAYRIFMRICEEQGLPADADLFAEVAADLAEEVAHEGEFDNDQED